MKKIAILGAGTWGIALARVLAVNGHHVVVWSKIPAEIERLRATRRHPNLPGMTVPDSIAFTTDIADCAGIDILLFAVPSVYLRATAQLVKPYVAENQIIVDVAKGIEPDTLLTMTGIIDDVMRSDGTHEGIRLVALSGPSHA